MAEEEPATPASGEQSSESVDLTDPEAIRRIYGTRYTERMRSSKDWQEWHSEHVQMLQDVRSASPEELASSEFQERLWERNPVSSSGACSVSTRKVVEDRALASWLAEKARDTLPGHGPERVAKMEEVFGELCKRVGRLTDRMPWVKILRVMASLFPEDFSNVVTAEADLLLGIRNGCFMEGSIGKASVRFTFQQTFPSYRPSHDVGSSAYSVSGERRPDMVLTVRDGNRTLLIILDAKYRCSRSGIHAALGDMHLYRDSLRISGGGPKPSVAFIVTPSHDAEGAGVYYGNEYRRTHGLGGFDLAPGKDHQAEALASFLSSLIASRGFALDG